MQTPTLASPSTVSSRVVARREDGLLILSSDQIAPQRRILYVNSYDGESTWNAIQRGRVPSNQLWGAMQLAACGYEVALAKTVPDFYLHRNPLPHDLRYFRFIKAWMRRDDLIYCGHNTLYWLPLLHAFGIIKPRIVSLLFAREPLDWARGHAGIIALTPAAAEQAKRLAPKASIAHLGWGADVQFCRPSPYRPAYFLSCGTTNRDHRTLLAAARGTRSPLRLICGATSAAMDWPANVTIVRSDWPAASATLVDPRQLCDAHFPDAAAAIIVLKHDPIEYTACGFTELLEVMAAARPVIVTRTGALPGEIDVERTGCGLHVPANDPAALADAVQFIADHAAQAEEMGRRARALCETHYSIDRFGRDLDRFFASL